MNKCTVEVSFSSNSLRSFFKVSPTDLKVLFLEKLPLSPIHLTEDTANSSKSFVIALRFFSMNSVYNVQEY